MTLSQTEPESETEAPAQARQERGRYMGVPKREILAAMAATEGLSEEDRAAVLRLGARLSLLIHLLFFSARERLKDLYARFNPDRAEAGPIPPQSTERVAFLAELDAAIEAANFERLGEDGIGSATDAAGRVSAQVRVPKTVFDAVRFYGRGLGQRPLELRRMFGLKRETVEAPVYRHVIFAASLRPDADARARGRLRPGAIYLKLFRDIPAADLESLYPNARVVMGLRDKLILGVPAVAGGIPILLNIVPALSVLFLVIGAYLGITGTVEGDAAKQALAALSGLGALIGFFARQWIKYERQKLRYQKQVAENAYFNSMNNNAGFFDTLIGQSEESEVKEALLAWFLLWQAGEPLARAALDARIEAWLRERFGMDVDFEIDDAMEKLLEHRLVEVADARYRAVPPETALERADEALARVLRAASQDSAKSGPQR